MSATTKEADAASDGEAEEVSTVTKETMEAASAANKKAQGACVEPHWRRGKHSRAKGWGTMCESLSNLQCSRIFHFERLE